jgi:hypothetical protein
MIESSPSGSRSKFFIFVQQDGWLQFGLRFINEVKIDLENINHFNKSYRFGKLCLDDDGDLFFSADMRVSLADISETFRDCAGLWDQLVGLLRKFLEDKREGRALS